MNNKGITLVSLVVAIIVMLILAGVSLSGILNTGTVEITKEVAFKSEAKDIKDAWETKIIGIDATFLDYENVTDILSDLNASEEMLSKLEIQNGDLVYKDDMCTSEEKQWFESIGIFGGVSIIANVKTNVRVLGETITTTKKQGMDVIIALDRSGSMRRYYDSTYTRLRIDVMADILNGVMKQVLNNDSRNRIGIVTFGGDATEYKVSCGGTYVKDLLNLDRYTSNRSDGRFFYYNSSEVAIKSKNGSSYYFKNSSNKNVNATMQAINYTGTYIQGGAYRAYQILKNRTDKTNLPVIFLITDGAPNDNWYNVSGGLSDGILTSPGKTNSYGIATTQANSIKRGLHTVMTLGLIKQNLPKSMIYTISIANLTNDIDKKYVELLLNPNATTISNAKKGKSNVTAAEGEIAGLNSTNLKKFATNVESLGTSYHYADGFSIGALSTSQFEALFAKFIEEIEVNLEKEYTVAQNNSITGIYEVDSDSLSLKTQIKDDSGKLIDHTYEFVLAEQELDGTPGMAKIKVTAAAYTPSSDGSASTKIQETEYTVESPISIQDIKDGVDPNLYYIDGTIKWNVRSEYKTSGGLAQQALDGVVLPNSSAVAAIEEVIIELPVNVLQEY